MEGSKEVTTVGTKVVTVYKLAPHIYAEFEKKVSRNFVFSGGTPTDAAYQLGIQHCLGMLRQGVVEDV